MNFQCASVILTLIVVNFKTSEGIRPRLEIVDLPADTGHRYRKIYKLGSPQPYYDNILQNPSLKQLINLLKRIKHVNDPNPFTDLTRGTSKGKFAKFSEDYIDISELARDSNTPNLEHYKLKPDQTKNILFDIHGNTYKVLKMLENLARRTINYRKRHSSSSEKSSSESDKTISDESGNYIKDQSRTRHNPKRFQVINNISGDSDDDGGQLTFLDSVDTEAKDDSDDEDKLFKEDEEPDTDSDSSVDELMYIQSPTRHIKTSQVDRRRRLQHFLPKRVHWSLRDFMDLNTYWINGPRGKYPAQHKTPY